MRVRARQREEDCILPAAGVAFTPPPHEWEDAVSGDPYYTCTRCDVTGRTPRGEKKVCWLCGGSDRLVER